MLRKRTGQLRWRVGQIMIGMAFLLGVTEAAFAEGYQVIDVTDGGTVKGLATWKDETSGRFSIHIRLVHRPAVAPVPVPPLQVVLPSPSLTQTHSLIRRPIDIPIPSIVPESRTAATHQPMFDAVSPVGQRAAVLLSIATTAELAVGASSWPRKLARRPEVAALLISPGHAAAPRLPPAATGLPRSANQEIRP